MLKNVTLSSVYWFDNVHQQQCITSSQTNTSDEDWKVFDPNTIHNETSSYFHGIPLPAVHDNTEGIAGVYDLWVDVPADSNKLWIDIGGGKSDAIKLWLENRYPSLKVYIMDPFQRSRDHNINVQNIISTHHGADTVSSISVLNVINTHELRIQHIRVVYNALKCDGIAYFKVWPGNWPDRGSGHSHLDEARNSYQANKWADAYIDEIAEIFGQSYVMADNTRNLLIAKKIIMI